MSEPLLHALLLLAALASCALGLAWLALAMDVHWAQARAGQPQPPGVPRILRVLGALALAVSLLLCFAADHATMAPLVWAMALAGAALIVAFALAWRPHWLAPLVGWVRAAAPAAGAAR